MQIERNTMTVPAHAVDTVFLNTWYAPAGVMYGKSRSSTVTAKINEAVEEWCAANDIVVTGHYNHIARRHHVVIYGDAQAMLFKLRWL